MTETSSRRRKCCTTAARCTRGTWAASTKTRSWGWRGTRGYSPGWRTSWTSSEGSLHRRRYTRDSWRCQECAGQSISPFTKKRWFWRTTSIVRRPACRPSRSSGWAHTWAWTRRTDRECRLSSTPSPPWSVRRHDRRGRASRAGVRWPSESRCCRGGRHGRDRGSAQRKGVRIDAGVETLTPREEGVRGRGSISTLELKR
mmetsp:Transcript_13954/g.22852  ORF Transcript_13954/g.22852 Transcript_13954/m.22852 type:complete len:200 (+) Transcript_13954:590-1189(+)